MRRNLALPDLSCGDIVLAKELADLTEADIQALIDDRTPESMTLEFKRDLPGKDDKGRIELYKDVCALANSDGGDLVFGVAESDGCAGSIAPITGENADDATRRIKQYLDLGVEPRLARLPVKAVPVAGGYVLVMRVPASFDGPHWVRVTNESRRFVYRDGGRVADMNYSQVQSAYLGADRLSNAQRAFRSRRISEALEDVPMPLSVPSGVVMLHLVPHAALAGRLRPDMADLFRQGYVKLGAPFWSDFDRRTTVDGLVVYEAPDEDGVDAYIQVFRDGCLESVFCPTLEVIAGAPVDGAAQISGRSLAQSYKSDVERFVRFARAYGAVGRAALGAAVLHAAGVRLSTGSVRRGRRFPADRDPLIIPEVIIERLEDDEEVGAAIRTGLDMVWQAFGEPRCTCYRDDGTWACD
ncbi:hypothetical protein IP84_00810 [beta proteobacterium AAP99]|nr:hypothetical protein IP84_00810 [beta proteobacterium AAP99]